jgi:hypothetical protein
VLDNFVTSALQEDHLSLGTGASLKLQRLLANLYQIMAIEYLLAAQGLEFHAQDMLAAGTRHALALLRQHVATWEDDRWLAPEIAKAVATKASRRLAGIAAGWSTAVNNNALSRGSLCRFYPSAASRAACSAPFPDLSCDPPLARKVIYRLCARHRRSAPRQSGRQSASGQVVQR